MDGARTDVGASNKIKQAVIPTFIMRPYYRDLVPNVVSGSVVSLSFSISNAPADAKAAGLQTTS